MLKCLTSSQINVNIYFLHLITQRSVQSSRRRTTIQFADIRQKRYSVPLMVGGLPLSTLLSGHINVPHLPTGLISVDRHWSPCTSTTKWCQWDIFLCCKYLQSCWYVCVIYDMMMLCLLSMPAFNSFTYIVNNSIQYLWTCDRTKC
jgi:hypothetical protein